MAERDAHALVPHLDAHGSVLLVGADYDDPALRRVFDRVGDEVSDDLSQSIWVPEHRERRMVDLDGHLVLRALLAVELGFFAEESSHVHQLLRALEAALLDSADVEEVVEKIREPACLRVDDAEVVPACLGVEVPREQELREPEDTGEGRTELV